MAVSILFRIGGLMALAFGAAHFAAWLRWRKPASLWWTASNTVGTVGAILMLGHGIVPGWAGQSLANTLIFSSTSMVWLGFRSLTGLPPRPWTAVAAALVFMAIFEALRLLVNDLGILILVVSLALGLINAVNALDLARAWPGQPSRLRTFLVGVFALHALFYLFRCTTAVTVDAGGEFLKTSGLQSATLLFGIFELMSWNAGGLWLVAERRQRRAVPAEAVA